MYELLENVRSKTRENCTFGTKTALSVGSTFVCFFLSRIGNVEGIENSGEVLGA